MKQLLQSKEQASALLKTALSKFSAKILNYGVSSSDLYCEDQLRYFVEPDVYTYLKETSNMTFLESEEEDDEEDEEDYEDGNEDYDEEDEEDE